jgi:hypothetical protein
MRDFAGKPRAELFLLVVAAAMTIASLAALMCAIIVIPLL